MPCLRNIARFFAYIACAVGSSGRIVTLTGVSWPGATGCRRCNDRRNCEQQK